MINKHNASTGDLLHQMLHQGYSFKSDGDFIVVEKDQQKWHILKEDLNLMGLIDAQVEIQCKIKYSAF
jgi:hypothetical protein